MSKKIYPILTLLIFLVGCTNLSNGQKLVPTVSSLLPSETIVKLPTTISMTITPKLIPSVTSSPTIEPRFPTETAIQPLSLNFDTGIGIEISSDQFNSECIGPKNVPGTDPSIGMGLMVTNRAKDEFQLWGKQGLKSIPSITGRPYSEISQRGSLQISPDGQWILSTSWKNNSNFDESILNIKTGKQIQKHFEGVEAGHVLDYWGDQNHIIISLANEVDLFKWLVWNPFNQELETISARLPGMGDIIDSVDSTRVYIYPVYDYSAGLVIYACKDCGKNEYQAFNPQTGKVQWGIDLGSDPLSFAQYPPLLSSTGEYIAIYFGEHKIWILDNKGESVLKVILPRDPIQAGVAQAFTWSPDGEYLALIRDSSDPDAPFVSIISIVKKQMVDICDKGLYYGTLTWSYDDQYLLHERQRGEEKQAIFTILGINSNRSYQFTSLDNLMILGWIKP